MKPSPKIPDTEAQMSPEADAAHGATVASDVMVSQKDSPDITGVSIRTLQRFNDAGDGPPRVRLGRRVLYPRSGLLAWVLRHAE